MKKEDFEKALQHLRNDSPKRNFIQSVECIITLKGLNLKKPEEQLDAFVSLPHLCGRKVKVAAFVGAELIDQAKKACQLAVLDDEFRGFEGDKKKLKQLADGYDFFLGQAALMPSIAKVFGRVLGPKGKMPNPKAGCVVPPNAVLAPVVERLQKTIRVQAKTMPMVQVVVGMQSMSDADLLDNVMAVYTHVVHALPGEENNVRSALLKYAMGPPVKVGVPSPAVVANMGSESVQPGKSDQETIKPLKSLKKKESSSSKKPAEKRASKKKQPAEGGE